jgi:hypothetical protein
MAVLTQHERCLRCTHLVKEEPGSMTVRCHCNARYPYADPPADCARDEAVQWLAQHYAGDDLDAAFVWMLAWANARAAQVQAEHVEALRDIALVKTAMESHAGGCIDTQKAWQDDEDTVKVARQRAHQALRWSAHVPWQ